MLARALRDPTLELAYWVPEYARLRRRARGAGRAARPTTATAWPRSSSAAASRWPRSSTTPSLRDEPELVGAVTSAAGIALENERLQADLRARLAELRASRARIVEAGDTARRKLERDLHDGAQQRLVSLAIVLRLLAGKLPADGPEARLLDTARDGADRRPGGAARAGPGHPPRRAERPRAGRRARVAGRPRAAARDAGRGLRRAAAARRSRSPPTTSWPRA